VKKIFDGFGEKCAVFCKLNGLGSGYDIRGDLNGFFVRYGEGDGNCDENESGFGYGNCYDFNYIDESGFDYEYYFE
jgi:hypothetical protein